MFPKSTRSGSAVAAFPDVCHTPQPPGSGPVPVPYPNLTAAGTKSSSLKTAGKATQLKVSGFQPTVGDQAGVLKSVVGTKHAHGVRTQLQTIHSQLAALPAGNPNRWHELIDQYVLLTAELYLTLTND
jgi:hypothetical protein